MRISYNIPTQTVVLDISPEEIVEMKDNVRERVKELFNDMIGMVRQESARANSKTGTHDGLSSIYKDNYVRPN